MTSKQEIKSRNVIGGFDTPSATQPPRHIPQGDSMFRKLVLIMLGMALVLSGCGSPKSTNEAGALTHVSLPMGYIANIQFAPSP